MEDDIIRFAGGSHTEAEKGEQFNKFIRSSLFYTNRQNTSHDVASRFGEETMLRHIAQGGVWGIKGEFRRGTGVTAFTASEVYSTHFTGSDRDHSDNNFVSLKKLSVGVAGVFFYYDSLLGTSRKIIGIISRVDRNSNIILVDAYSIVAHIRAEGSFQSIFNILETLWLKLTAAII